MAGVFCDGPDGRACFLRRLVMFFASVECVFCVGGVFCVGNSCFLRRWLVFVFFATVPVGGVFCNGGGCFLRRS